MNNILISVFLVAFFAAVLVAQTTQEPVKKDGTNQPASPEEENQWKLYKV